MPRRVWKAAISAIKSCNVLVSTGTSGFSAARVDGDVFVSLSSRLEWFLVQRGLNEGVDPAETAREASSFTDLGTAL